MKYLYVNFVFKNKTKLTDILKTDSGINHSFHINHLSD